MKMKKAMLRNNRQVKLQTTLNPLLREALASLHRHVYFNGNRLDLNAKPIQL